MWVKERGRKNGNPILHYFLAPLASSFSPSIEVNWSSRTSERLWQLTVLIRCTCVSCLSFFSFLFFFLLFSLLSTKTFSHFRFSAPFFWTLITSSYLHLVVYWWSLLFASAFRVCACARKKGSVRVKGKRKEKERNSSSYQTGKDVRRKRWRANRNSKQLFNGWTSQEFLDWNNWKKMFKLSGFIERQMIHHFKRDEMNY